MLRKEERHVVILGGGFGGLAAARALTVPGVRVTLVDRSNHHLFQPLLYQVATAALAAPDVSAPIRQLLWRQHNATVLMGGVERIEVEKKRVLVEGRHIDYDYLVLATGMTHAYFGHDKWAAHAPGLKTVGEALDVRRRILRAFEAAELETSPEDRRAWTTFVVDRRRSHRRRAGGRAGRDRGAHAGARLPALRSPDDARHPGRGRRRASCRPSPRSCRARRSGSSSELGIEVRTGTRGDGSRRRLRRARRRVDRDAHGAVGGGRPRQPAASAPGRAARSRGTRLGRGRSVRARSPRGVRGGRPHREDPGRQAAARAWRSSRVQSGRHVARTIRCALGGKRPRRRSATSTRARWRPSGATRPSRRSAASSSQGFFAWWLWLTVHLLSLVGFRSRLAVLMEWALSYFTWQRGSRVILEVPAEPPERRASLDAGQRPPRAAEDDDTGRRAALGGCAWSTGAIKARVDLNTPRRDRQVAATLLPRGARLRRLLRA